MDKFLEFVLPKVEILIREHALVLLLLVMVCVYGGYKLGTWYAARPTSIRAVTTKRKSRTHDYGVTDAYAFYSQVAAHYDRRNTEALLDTHKRVIHHIEEAVRPRRRCAVLDLGGGTGRLIALHFFHRPNMSWTYVDHNEQMLAQFHSNLSSAPLKIAPTMLDVRRLPEALQETSYDIVVMSYLLSSMPEWPDFQVIAHLMRHDGRLIVAEAEPSYVASRPDYDFNIDGERYALRLRPIDLADLRARAIAAGLKEVSRDEILNKRGETYSYVTVFARGVV